MKQFESEGASWTKSDTLAEAVTDKAAPKAQGWKETAPKPDAKVEEDASGNEEEPPTKKAKTKATPKKKGMATTKNSKKATEVANSEEDTA